MLIQYRVRPFPHPVRLLAKNPDPGLKSKICKIFRKIIFFRIVQNVALVVALFVKILQTPKYYNRGITRQLRNLCLRPKNILIFSQQNSCFVYLPQVGIPSHVLLSPAQLEGQEELLEKGETVSLNPNWYSLSTKKKWLTHGWKMIKQR